MKEIVQQFVDYVASSQHHNKQTLIDDVLNRFQLTRDRSVYYCSYFAVRFCQTKGKAFSNTVLSLSALQKFDAVPFFVVQVSKVESPRVFLANSTFIAKISHSSQQLSLCNIKGSFNGSDIIKTYQGIPNDAQHFTVLFPFHLGMTWEDNLNRLVSATNNIAPTGHRYDIDADTRAKIHRSVDRAVNFMASDNYRVLCEDLGERVRLSETAILCAARIENVNIRGRLIEALITSDADERSRIARALQTLEEELPVYGSKNELGDYCRRFDNGNTYIDIKTKIVYLDSNPKAYNVDKFLEVMAEEDSVFFLYFVGIDKDCIVNRVLCSVYHRDLVKATVVQKHWAGRNSRGVAQLIGKTVDIILRQEPFRNEVDAQQCHRFLDGLIDME